MSETPAPVVGERRDVTSGTKTTRTRTAEDTETTDEVVETGAKKAPAKKAPAKKAAAKKPAAKASGRAKKSDDDEMDDDVDLEDEVEDDADADAGDDSDDADADASKGGKKDAADDDADDEDEEGTTKPAFSEPLPTGAIVISSSDDEDVPVYSTQITGATADPVKDYLKQIGKVPLLNAAEEVELAMRI